MSRIKEPTRHRLQVSLSGDTPHITFKKWYAEKHGHDIDYCWWGIPGDHYHSALAELVDGMAEYIDALAERDA